MLNEVNLIGRLGTEPELKTISTGNTVCRLSIATTEKWTDKSGQKQEKTEWHRVVVWGKLAELCAKYLSKGSQAFVKGRLQTRSYEKDGQKFYVTEIVASQVQFLDGAKSQASNDDNHFAEPNFGDGSFDNIPF